MKILQKQSLLNMLEMLNEYHNHLSYTDIEKTKELLCIFQEYAIEIGTLIENENKDAITITLLEDYCEKLYQISLLDYSEQKWNSYIDELHLQIIDIKKSIELNINSELHEVIFLPYNASMWDSMDSVYRQAINDERFKVTVLPIPYYNINKNSGDLDEKYEGDKLPEYVKITDYKKYNIKERKPDIIFIHNPYDEYNFVTRVFKEFYSSELIKYTDHLVYIPYYVSENETMEQFCILPGVKNAWRVIVQSENIRKQYLKYYDQDKIVALGSPKIDMLLQINNNEKSIPNEWKNALENRKVFLYNTHLQNVINESKALLKKLRYVFSMFNERDDIAIIWRPHPLSIQTARSLSPEMLDEYLDIIKSFKLLNNAVYDDSSDLYRSIALSDAYIGDECSSVVKLYGITGKPMLFLNEINLLENKPERYIRTLSPAIFGDKIYMFSWEYNALYCMDLNYKKTEYITSFCMDENMKQNLYTASVVDRGKIYNIPCNAKQITVFDPETQNTNFIYFNREEEYNEYNVCRVEDKIYLIPIYYANKAFCIDTNSDSIFAINTDYENTLYNFKDSNVMPLFYGKIIHDNRIWRVSRFGPFVQAFDYVNGVFEYHKIMCSVNSFRDIAYDGEYFWILPNGNEDIIKWNPKSNNIDEIFMNLKSENESENLQYNAIHYAKGFIWLIPEFADEIIKVNIINNKIKKIPYDILNKFKKDYHNAKAFNNFIENGNNLLLFPYRSNSIISINMNTDAIEAIQTEIPQNNEFELIDCITNGKSNTDVFSISKHSYYESICSLNQFIYIITNSLDQYDKQRANYYSFNIDNDDGSCGEKIWKYIIEQLKIL